ncbi:uncharacterized protein PFB0145c-like isoform X2 [Ostrinia furnacalis]|uniref:uncharacterized protein PFB0145c-like isoform X1 n=1 Tax=Ostrinia furnacalis TaxID=93504 RepID=UPI00103C8602|nr:uncharacterized protein PFB0145c-like isoform X1 [Ostrinia furnacalis]XP_028171711.1 uncharacterized protein PFB0145c-like isoform X2 [Ostrinia furnacalis]
MPASETMSTKKKELLAYKAKILQEIKYYEKRINEVTFKCAKNTSVEDSDSSEEEFSLTIDNGPSMAHLKQQQAMQRTCLHATQELTSVQVLQSEVNMLVDDPEIIGEPPVTEPGLWREVTAECRVDLVPFSITFFVHQPSRQFGQLSYRGLRVAPVKSAHEGELGRSVLPSVMRPSDAVEVLKSYAAAQRSRRTTLARLADKYANSLYMEPMQEGGYILKCANLLEVSWTLQNKWSPIAPFHHRMKFDLEYMDESYIKIITQAHRQLSDPSLETDERTLLLSKIISTCLEAQGPTQELYESMSSDPENNQSFRSRRTTLDQEPDDPGMKKKKETELMAPPKSLPKKTKLKGKENIADNRKEKLKRGNSDENMENVKKLKTDLGAQSGLSENGAKDAVNKDKSDDNNSNSNAKPVDRASVASNKKGEVKKVQNKKEIVAKKVGKETNDADILNSVVQKSNENSDKPEEATQSKNIQNADREKNTEKQKQVKEKVAKAAQSTKKDDNNDQKTVANPKKTNKTTKSDNNLVNKEKPTEKSEKVKSGTNKTKAETKNADINNAKDKLNTEKGDKIKSVASVKNKNTTNEQGKKSNKPDKEDNVKGVASAKKQNNEQDKETNKAVIKNAKSVATVNKEPIKTKAPVKPVKESVNSKNTNENIKKTKSDVKKDTVRIQNKAQNDKMTKNTNQDGKKVLQNPKNSVKNVPSDINKENTLEKVVENRKSSVKRKSNLIDKIDGVASAKKPNVDSSEKNKKNIDNKKVPNSKTEPKFKSKFIPGGLKTHTGNTKVLGNIDKQNSDKKSKIPQKKLSPRSEATLKKNPLRISPRKIPSKFKNSSDMNKMKTIQKTTSIPRLLKKPAPKT